ncbi:hypothetical protein BC943DRAFT_338165 [Umbelopsis sp. AD052]|nr:hypothetical protein BC943DRAFT_338165 [Umbelopsis sp. AD052]
MIYLVANPEEALMPLYRASLDAGKREAPLSRAGLPPPVDEDDDSDYEYEYEDLPPTYEQCVGLPPGQTRSGNGIVRNIKYKIGNVKASLSRHSSTSKTRNDNKVPQDAKTNPME